MGIQKCFAKVNGITLHYVTQGQGEPVIFLHGFPACWYVWKPQLQQFSQMFWTIAPDGRGVNRSSKPAQVDAYKIDTLAQDVIALADLLQIETCTLVGHDWGGTLAWKIAQSYPHRVKRLIVTNAPPLETFLYALATTPEQRAASAYMNRLMADTAEASLLANACHNLWQISFEEHLRRGVYNTDDKAFFVRSWQLDGALTGFLNWYRANIPAFDTICVEQYAPASQPIIKVPSLLLWGEHERAFTSQLLALVPEYVSTLDVIHVAGGGHWLSIEKPALFFELVMDFVRRTS